jgi:hypothetical protein
VYLDFEQYGTQVALVVSFELLQVPLAASPQGLDRYSGLNGDFVLILGRLSCGFEADSTDEGIEIIDDALVEAVELRALLLVEPSSALTGLRRPAASGA